VQFPAIDESMPAGFGEVEPRCQSRYGELPLSPDARSCQTPPRACRMVLLMATARPQVVQSWMRLTRWRPKQPICAGKVAGMAFKRRSLLRNQLARLYSPFYSGESKPPRK
jgi:hypothetical protein